MLSEAQELGSGIRVSAGQCQSKALWSSNVLLVDHVITKSLFSSHNVIMDKMELCSIFLNVSCSHVLKILQRILCDSRSGIENIYHITNEKNAALFLLLSNKKRN